MKIMHTTVARWGNSLAIRLPKSAAELSDLHEGDAVEINIDEHGQLVVRPAREYFTIEQLIVGMTPENRHEEMFPDTIGREIW
jgi:antitoxin MazE